MSVPTYPFSNDRVRFSQAVAFIAAVVNPGERPSRARKIVRDRLFRYRRDGRIPGGSVIPADVFFRTVLDHFPDWQRLRRVKNLPGVERPFDQADVQEKARASDAVTAFVIPGDLVRAQALIEVLQKENQNLQVRIQDLEAQVKNLEPYRTKDLEKRKKISNTSKGKRRHRA